MNIIKLNKNNDTNITCGISLANLFSTENTDLLFNNMDTIDCFSSGICLNDKSYIPQLFKLVKNGKITIKNIINKYYYNPIKIFNLDNNINQKNTYIEVDKLIDGLIRRIVVRNKVIFTDGEVISKKIFVMNIKNNEAISDNNKINYSNFKLENILNIDYKNNKYTDSIKLNAIISVDQFDRNILRVIFNTADKIKLSIKNNEKLDTLNGKIMTLLFYDPSTSTKCSFSAAMKKLGGSVIDIDINSLYSSIKNGESFEDTIKTLEYYSDIIILRTNIKNIFDKIKNIIHKPIINASDDIHPTQALLDIYTIREERGTVNGLTIAILGDLKNNTTVHSFVKLLCLYDVRLRFISPPSLEIPQHIINYIKNQGLVYTKHYDLNDILNKIDILYVTRIQKENFESINEYNNIINSYIITPETLTKPKSNMIIMHQLPRINEINTDIDNDPRAAYFRQIEYGLYIKMAILTIIF